MTAVSERYRRLAAQTTETVRAVPAERWSRPSPCEGWTARDVVRHLVDTHGMFLGFAGGSLGDIPSIDEDPLAAWEAARDAMRGPGAFGPAVEPPTGADQQTRVLAFLGRRSW